MTYTSLPTVVIGIASLPLALAARQDHEAASCPRGPHLLVTEKGVVRDVTNDPPCRLVFRKTGVRLAAVADGSRPDPGPLVVKDSRGRYYSANADGWESTISVWSRDGTYITSFGRAGEGPGEFGGGWLSLFVDDGDSVHVHDPRDWTVFSPEYDFARQAPSRLMGSGSLLGPMETIVLYHGGGIVASNAHQSTGDAYFRIVNRDGSLEGTFATSEDGTGTAGSYGHDRAMAFKAGWIGIWAAPALEGANEYVLEHWDPVGGEGLPDGVRRPTLIQSLRRNAPWFKWTEDRNSSSGVRYLHITEDDLLYVQLWRPSDEFAEAMERYAKRMAEGGGEWTPELEAERDALQQSLTHVVIEVIDVRSTELLVSATYPAGEVLRGDPLLPHRFFRNEMTGYVYAVGEDGLPYVEIIEGVLEKK